MIGYPLDRVHQEAAFLGRHVHWTLTEVLQLDHGQRVRWVREVEDLVEREQQRDDPWR